MTSPVPVTTIEGEPEVRMAEGESRFAGRLRELREAAGLSQYALAKRSGLTKQAISRLEHGTRDPAWETVQRLALALGVDCRSFGDPSITLPGVESRKSPGRPPKPAAEAERPAEPKKRGRPRKTPPENDPGGGASGSPAG